MGPDMDLINQEMTMRRLIPVDHVDSNLLLRVDHVVEDLCFMVNLVFLQYYAFCSLCLGILQCYVFELFYDVYCFMLVIVSCVLLFYAKQTIVFVDC